MDFLLKQGGWSAYIRDHDWASTPLGPIESWPRSLKSYVGMILAMPTPAIIFWGPEHLQLYNEGYSVIMGPRHPRHLGSTYRECWPDTYPTIHPWMDRVLQGEVVQVDRTLFPLTRHGFVEEAYFSFTFSPLRDDEDAIAGVLQPVLEVTRTVLSERRLEVLRALAPKTGALDEGPQGMMRILATNPHDIPFALLYLWSASRQRLELVAHQGLTSPGTGDARLGQLARAAQEAFDSQGAVRLREPEALSAPLHPGPWPEPACDSAALPLRRTTPGLPVGVVVLGISSRLRFDAPYESFFEALARELSHLLVEEQARLSQAALLMELEHTNARLRETSLSDRRFKNSFAHATVGLAIADTSGRLREVNPSFQRLMGYSEQELRRLSYQDLTHPEDLEHCQQLIEQLISGASPGFTVEKRFVRKDGRIVWVHNSVTIMRGEEGSASSLVALAQDITERKQVEAALREAVRSRDEFLSIASHELKTPLTSLSLLTQGARRSMARDPQGALEPVKVKKLILHTDKSVQRLTHLVDDMLDISRISTGKLTLSLEFFDLCEFVQEVASRLSVQAQEAQTSITVRTCGVLVGQWDRFRLEQVITNLLTNALRYGQGSPITLEVLHDCAHALIRISDQGMGVAPEDQERIFQRFERANTASALGGLGLGLYICREIVERHGGTIRVESTLGQGATFIVELPGAHARAHVG